MAADLPAVAKPRAGTTPAISCLLTGLFVSAATGLTALLWPHNKQAPFTFYYLAVIAAVIYGRALAGGLSVVLSALAATFLFIPRLFTLAVRPDDLIAPGLFVAVAGLVVLLVDRMRKVTLHHVDQSAAQALEIERLNRLYAALSQINQAIVWMPTRERLFEKVCAVLVTHGGFRMAWIGWVDQEHRTLVPVAQTGDEGGYLQSIGIFANDNPQGHGPSSATFRTGQPSICNDLLTDAPAPARRSELQRRAFRSSAVFPIRLKGEIQGTLNVYAAQPAFFQDKETALLAEAAVDISFALDNLASAAEHLRAEETVKRLGAIVESTDDAIISKTLDGNIVTWNPAAERMFGYGAPEIIGRSIETLIPGDRLNEEPMILRRIKNGERIKQLETIRLRKNGELFPVAITFSPIWGPDGENPGGVTIVGVSKIVRDITDRRHIEALAERERGFATGLIESLPGILYLYNQDGQFLRWNRNLESVSGYSASEIRTMHPLDFFLTKDRRLLQERIAEVFTKGESMVEASFLSKDGSVRPFVFTGKRISYDGATCLVGVGVDITDWKRAEEALAKSEERYRTTLDNILEGCQLIGFDWRYLYLNDAAATHNRRPNHELLGQRMPDQWPGIEESDVFALMKRCMEERVALHEETEFVFADGTSGWFDVRAQPVPEGVFVLSIDISERKKAEVALRALNDSLELKVAERTTALDAARERAESADRLKSAFLATMSHELRTPLNSIIGFTGIIVQGLAGPLNPEQEKQLGMVQGSARHLLELINDVLDISRIEAGQLEIHVAPFDLLASIERVTASVRPMLDKKGLVLHVALPPTIDPIESDRRRVEQVLLNLLNNAIKFTDRGSITLTAEVLGESVAFGAGLPQPAVRIQIADTGIGIRKGDLTTLFQPFRQIDAGLERQHEGTGLGLAICRRLIELMRGTIGVDSTPGEGSAFAVTLPLKHPS